MRGINRNAPLIGGQQPDSFSQEWFQMEDYRYPHTRFPSKPHQPSQHHYQRLDNPAHCRKYVIQPNQPHPNAVMGQPFSDKIIKMNGATFKLVEKDGVPQQKLKNKSQLPPMNVECYDCSMVQVIPGTSELFTCWGCGKINECTPAFRLIRCRQCNGKVLYGTGTSLSIKCTRCQAINQVEPLIIHNPYQVHPQPQHDVFKIEHRQK